MVVARPDVHGLYLLNPTASEIWLQSRSGKSPEAAAFHLTSVFGIDFETAFRDVNVTLQWWGKTIFAESTSEEEESSFCLPNTSEETIIDCRLHGRAFRIVLSSKELAAEIAPRVECLRVPERVTPDITFRLGHTSRSIFIFRDDELVSVQDHPADARVILLNEIVRSSVSANDFLTVFHAGAVGSESRCVIFPAQTEYGKTTLAAILLASGFTFFADDSVAIWREGLSIATMPFPLTIREGSWSVVASHLPELHDVPIDHRYGEQVKFLYPEVKAENRSTKACAIVFTRWDRGAKTTVSSLTTFEALLRLRDSGFWLAHDFDAIGVFLDWLQRLPVYEITYSDVGDAVAFMRKLLVSEMCYQPADLKH